LRGVERWLGFSLSSLGRGKVAEMGEDEDEGKLGNPKLSASYKVGSYSHVATWSSPPFMMPHGNPKSQ